MSERGPSAPPRLWLAIVRALVARDRRDEIAGDLVELWALRRPNGGLRTRLRFWQDAWSVVRPSQSNAPVLEDEGDGAIGRHLRGVARDVRYAVRLMGRQPLFTLLAVGTLTLGIGSATAIFTVCDRVLLRPLAYPDPDRLVELPDVPVSFGQRGAEIPSRFRELPEFSALGMYQPGGLNLGEPAAQRLRAAAVNAGFFRALGVRALAGRTPVDDEDARAKVAVVAFETWRRVFGGDERIVGQQIRLNSQAFTVIGVMPRGFTFPGNVDVWVPPFSDAQMTGMAYTPSVIGRLAPGVPVAQAMQAVTRTNDSLDRHSDAPARMPGLKDQLVQRTRPTLIFLVTVVGLLLVVACANVAGLLLSRLGVRARELQLRVALGASRTRIGQQLATESLLLSGFGVLAGLGAAAWMVRAFAAGMPAFAPAVDLTGLDARFFLVGGLISIVSCVAFGCGPALAASRAAAAHLAGQHVTSSRRMRWFGNGLVVSQVSVALILLVTTAAALTVVVRLARVDLGFSNEQAIVLELTLPRARYRAAPAAAAFLADLDTRLRLVPHINHVGATNFGPGSTKVVFMVSPSMFDEAPRSRNGNERPSLALQLSATPDYFQAMGIPLIAGRAFTAEDRAGAPKVVILSESAARRLNPQVDRLIGQRVRVDTDDRGGSTIVGIVSTVRLYGPSRDAGAQLYQPLAQSASPDSLAIAISGTAPPDAIITAARDALRQIDPDLPAYNVASVGDLRALFVPAEHATLAIASAFSMIALVLCAVGLYGTLAQLVAQRTRELGIRMALGADRARLRWSVVGAGLRLTIAGVVLGGLAAGIVFKMMASLVPLLEVPHPSTIAASTGVLLAVAVLAAWVPARRASAVDPIAALRAE